MSQSGRLVLARQNYLTVVSSSVRISIRNLNYMPSSDKKEKRNETRSTQKRKVKQEENINLSKTLIQSFEAFHDW